MDKQKGLRHYKVFVDETGQTPYYNDEQQPYISLVGVITDKEDSEFNDEFGLILKEFNLDKSTEIHTAPLISGAAPFDKIPPKKRNNLLFQFLEIGVKYIDLYHAAGNLKPFTRTIERQKVEERNLDPYLSMLHYFMTSLDFYMDRELKSCYSIYFDACSDFNKRTKRMILELCKPSEKHYSLKRLVGAPKQIDSANSRFIQLADAICYMSTRSSQIFFKTYKGRKRFSKHEGFIKKCCSIFTSKGFQLVRAPKSLEDVKNSVVMDVEFKSMSSDWENRDFSHMGRWLSKKRKSDQFRHDVNENWEAQNRMIGELNRKVDQILARIPSVKAIGKSKFLREVYIEIFSQYKELVLYEYKNCIDFPELKKLLKRLDELIPLPAFDNNFNTKTSLEAIKFAESILKAANLIPVSDDEIINRLPKITLTFGVDAYSFITILKAVKNEMDSLFVTVTEFRKKYIEKEGGNGICSTDKLRRMESIFSSHAIKVGEFLNILGDSTSKLEKSAAEMISNSDLAFTYQRRWLNSSLNKFIIVAKEQKLPITAFKKLLLGFSFNSYTLFEVNSICIKRYDKLIKLIDKYISILENTDF